MIIKYEEIVFARTTPEQKLKTVKEFQRNGYIIGVTGDGVNDAPALKSADIGIAMGGGSEVAMEAAHLVLLDNNFESVPFAIESGRLVYYNLRKVLLYLLPGGCMAELVPVLMAIILGVPQNLSSFQMLIICLFTDVAPCLSLIMEKPETDLLNQPPRSKNDRIVDWKSLLQAYLFMGTFISFFSQCMNFWYFEWYANYSSTEILFSFGELKEGFHGLKKDQIDEHFYTGQTVTFVSIVLLNIFGNLLSNRTSFKSGLFQLPPWGKSGNYWILVAQITSIAILAIAVYSPLFNYLFNTRSIPFIFVILPLALSLLLISIDELRKYFVRNKLFGFDKIGW